MFKKIFQPEIYQGSKKKRKYFEGWYFKLVSKDESYALALIPGISKNEQDPHAFIQVFFVDQRGETPILKTHYIRYHQTAFRYRLDRFHISIDQNEFTKSEVVLNINQDDLYLNGSFRVNNPLPINKSLLSPSIMGFFGYFRFMECYHGVISMRHHLNGLVNYQHDPLIFDDGVGYLEKDWGKSFPRAYVWLQTNHFSNENVSFMFSYADIPFLGFYFKGLISVLNIDGKEYRFATYNFSKILLEDVGADHVHYNIKKGRYTLEVYATKDHSVDLPSPKDGVMNQTIKEGLSGVVEVKLYHKGNLVYQGKGSSAGIEIMK